MDTGCNSLQNTRFEWCLPETSRMVPGMAMARNLPVAPRKKRSQTPGSLAHRREEEEVRARSKRVTSCATTSPDVGEEQGTIIP